MSLKYRVSCLGEKSGSPPVPEAGAEFLVQNRKHVLLAGRKSDIEWLQKNGETLVSKPLRALGDNPSGSIWQRTRDSISLWFE